MLRGVDARAHATGLQMRGLLERGSVPPEAFRAALTDVSPRDRDAWTDLAFGLPPPPDDGPELPRGCVPYLPCPVDALLRAVDGAQVTAADRFVDVGSGAGRAAAVVNLLTGASVVGIEVQPALVASAHALTARLRLPDVSFLTADAATLPAAAAGTVFLLYCPFSGDRLAQFLAQLQAQARTRTIRLCCVDLPLPPTPWLSPLTPPAPDLTIYRSRSFP
jgi:SAM-dependent methyltransferase